MSNHLLAKEFGLHKRAADNRRARLKMLLLIMVVAVLVVGAYMYGYTKALDDVCVGASSATGCEPVELTPKTRDPLHDKKLRPKLPKRQRYFGGLPVGEL